ncbi:alpha-ketoglutarate-dependent dioxygenase AlkB [Aliikangiella sp. G2MR2-5]|uniref:alpha-ketoglutarate-dependent dioxygenase AlkB n=1 Tax=Aliikangiella sp. G2MR2-5 TaxID=2788943 RepID=UPI0018ABEBD4|nr:alpha-ketoglutarate-dependent dioxygenase AlkB [Aliikangiella sp. G2MR2-5]
MSQDLFSSQRPDIQEIYPEVYLLADFVDTQPLLQVIWEIAAQSPFRKMQTPMGHYTGIELTNCGPYGWVSDSKGYRYAAKDPLTGKPWPAMPQSFFQLAKDAAFKSGFKNFNSDACLINHYQIGDKLGSHQDKDEGEFDSPIVSVSIGLPATFQIFGKTRSGVEKELMLHGGDVLVWGGDSRLIYHGVKTIKADKQQPNLTERFNITFRKAVKEVKNKV